VETFKWNEQNWKGRFFTVWGGGAISLFGSQLVQFALIWWLTQKTNSATILATAALVGFLPNVLIGPLAGTLIDRWNRRFTMILSDSTVAAATLVLAYLFAVNKASIGWIYGILFIRALGSTFHVPSMTAATSLMVPKGQLTRVQGLNQMLEGGLNIISAPLGAILLSLLPMQRILLVDVGTALLAISSLLFIRIPEPRRDPHRSHVGNNSSLWGEFRTGLDYIRRWPGLLMLIGMAMIVNFLLNPAATLFPILITGHFGGSALQLGWMESAIGIGVVSGGLLLGIWGGFKKRIRTSILGLVGLGIGFASLGMLPSSAFPIALGGTFLAGFMLPLVNGPARSILQSIVAPDMQGRVFSLLGSLGSGMAPLGLIIAGPVADLLGVQSWYLIGGCTCILVGVSGYFLPVLMNIEENREALEIPKQNLDAPLAKKAGIN